MKFVSKQFFELTILIYLIIGTFIKKKSCSINEKNHFCIDQSLRDLIDLIDLDTSFVCTETGSIKQAHAFRNIYIYPFTYHMHPPQ